MTGPRAGPAAAARRFPYSEAAAKDALAGMLDGDLPVSVVEDKAAQQQAAQQQGARRGKKRARAKRKNGKFVFVKLQNLHDKLVDSDGNESGWQVFIGQDGTTSAHWAAIKKRMGPYYGGMDLDALLACEDIVPLEQVSGGPVDPAMPFPKAKYLIPRLAQRWRYCVTADAHEGAAPQDELVAASSQSSSSSSSSSPAKSKPRAAAKIKVAATRKSSSPTPATKKPGRPVKRRRGTE